MKHLIFALVGLALASLTAAAPAAAQDSYRIKAGDVLRIEVLEDAALNRSVLVLPDGRISMPLVGTLKVSDQSVEEVGAALSAGLAPNFATPPTVYVGLDRLAEAKPAATGGAPAAAASLDVYVIGEAAKPGKHAVAPGTTILQFVAEMGGFTKFAATGRIQLRRTDASGTEKVYVLNYKAVENGAASTLVGTVADGDVFVIPPRRLFE